MSFLKIGSWHKITRVDDSGWHTRCGRLVVTESVPASDHLPLGEKSCESCLRLGVYDEGTQAVENGEVIE